MPTKRKVNTVTKRKANPALTPKPPKGGGPSKGGAITPKAPKTPFGEKSKVTDWGGEMNRPTRGKPTVNRPKGSVKPGAPKGSVKPGIKRKPK